MLLMQITKSVEHAVRAAEAGVDRIFIDLEWIGKEERQGHLDTHRAHHSIDDISAVRAALPRTEIMVRVNPVYDGTISEINQAIDAGADRLMLPMFTTVEEVGAFVSAVSGRAPITLLLETPQAAARVDAFLNFSDEIDEIHVGLNDLHLGLGLDFMFELVSGGLVEYLGDKIRAAGVRFGFGGVASIGAGLVPAELVIGEHVRLGSEMVILSRGFNAPERAREIDLQLEVSRLRQVIADSRQMSTQELEDNRQRFIQAVETVRVSKGRMVPEFVG